MKKPGRTWSWKTTLKNATAGAGNGAFGGLAAGILVPDPTGMAILVSVGAGIVAGFGGVVIGDGIGYALDDEFVAFASPPLYIFVVGLLLALPLVVAGSLLRPDDLEIYRIVSSVVFLSNVIGAASARLIDDIRSRNAARQVDRAIEEKLQR